MVFRRNVVLIGFLGLVIWASSEAAAREVNLGGQRAPGEAAPQLPANIVELPPIIIAIRKTDGGWRHVRIDAWLAPKDTDTAESMDEMKSVITRSIQERIPKADFEALAAAHSGSALAKEVIHAAAEQGIGRSWSGDVLIRQLLVY
jgi:hypothetical protein